MRSTTGRRVGSSRVYSRKPVTLPMDGYLGRNLARFGETDRVSARHARRKVAPGAPKDDDQPLGHVFAPVIASAFYHSGDAGVSHGKPLASHAVEERLATCGTVQYNISDQNV